MKKFLMATSAAALCLAAPAFAQTTTGQDSQYPPRASQAPASQTPASQAAPRRSGQPQSLDSSQQPDSRGGQAQNQQQPRSTSGQAQSQQQPPSGSGQAQSQQPSANGQAQNQQPDAGGRAQNQQQPSRNGQAQSQQPRSDQSRAASGDDRNQPDRAQDQRQPRNAQAPADRNRAAAPARDQQGQADRRQSSQSRQDRQQQDAQTSRQRDNRDSAGRASNAARVNLDERQRTRIASIISTANVRPIDVNFRIETGVVVPATVTLRPLPTNIVEIVPRYRGYSFFLTRDEKIVIVAPRTKKVVEVISTGGAARAQATSSKVAFTDEQRKIIRQRTTTVERAPATMGSGSSQIAVEQEVPAAIELEEFPAEVVTEVPAVRTYRYFRQDDDVVVVEPRERRVIEIIR